MSFNQSNGETHAQWIVFSETGAISQWDCVAPEWVLGQGVMCVVQTANPLESTVWFWAVWLKLTWVCVCVWGGKREREMERVTVHFWTHLFWALHCSLSLLTSFFFFFFFLALCSDNPSTASPLLSWSEDVSQCVCARGSAHPPGAHTCGAFRSGLPQEL